MKIASGIEMLELQVETFGSCLELNPTLIWDDETAILIDTGTPRQLEQIRAAMDKAGVFLDKLKVVILTHQDLDHIGSLPEILQESGGGIEVYAHELDAPYIEGKLPLLKGNPDSMAWQLESLPEAERRKLLTLVENPPKAKVDKTLADGQKLPYCGGIHVIFTPGHTPGHISLYLEQSKTLVVGDAMFSVKGILMGPHPQSTPDMNTALRSLEKYLDFDIQTVICYHGGLSRNNIKDQLQKLIRK
ncbi:MBL fold metallo-hydrolase [Aneurinibacillus aneurinilyticus]|uniref:Metallo-beta-lactamase domain protein n=2 Tax=Bacteria TaxID=2 RepID=U1X050_ANEAE|nr:MBL fold metallo-hydrolase [Aneurinibacillus aneurinilyticus]ERI07888.1 metallo-beta-lactamase domain protein [Aneurinibacillus aneurinilyticus ATCC 12856]MED0705796.1 MBL fold metallo-hydrolase [Aneurinibacillus aneurinilyticus]MED0722882.1 MBL fold metallo-hydrolase [Aneurinibacillus aneurinilyticus]MED0734796.1 MBL fold metallo-hydrolase [Aneurinibacillus aneurinilyticus]MED0743737.1 MBL fold metallo-hydrolase [Aneurinibacillus aneurinilyticus]